MLFRKTKPVLIVGCGRFGASLAGTINSRDYEVTVIDKDKAAFSKLPGNFGGYEIAADGSDITILEDAGIKDAEIVIAATGSDCTNSLVCQIASRIFHVHNVYMRLEDPVMERVVSGYGMRVIYPFRLSMREFERLSGIDLEEEV